MCWSATVSINTYAFSLFASVFALANNIITPMEFVFIQSYIMMQLAEYFIWSKSASNDTLSKFAFLLILSQPIFSILAIKSHKQWIPYLLAGYAAFLALLFITHPWSSIKFSSTKAENGHLAWNWLNFPLWLISIWMFFQLIRFIVDKQYIMFFIILMFIITCYVLYHKTLTWGSMWCWAANVVAFYLIGQVFMKELCR